MLKVNHIPELETVPWTPHAKSVNSLFNVFNDQFGSITTFWPFLVVAKPQQSILLIRHHFTNKLD